MAVLTIRQARRTRNDAFPSYGSAVCTTSQTIFEGALVMITTATGLALNGADTASCGFVGICTKTVTAAPAGTRVYFKWGHEELMTCNATLAAIVNSSAVIFDNDGVTTAAAATNDVKVGNVTEFVSATQAWIAIRVAASI